jgi:hypothetical protein
MGKLARTAWVVAAVGILLTACGEVTDSSVDAATGANGNGNGNGANGNGNGNGQIDAGAECPGDVDADGACLCGPREAGELCEDCAEGWSGPEAGCAEFFDNFNRSAGALGGGWEPVTLPGAEDALIVNNRACGDVQSVGFLAEPIGSAALTASFEFEAANQAGLEVAFLFSPDDDLSTVYIVGCEGGNDECTLKIGRLTETYEEVAVPELAPSQRYRFELSISPGNANIHIWENGSPVADLEANLPVFDEVRRLGFIVGRQNDNALSCIDDFSVTIQ